MTILNEKRPPKKRFTIEHIHGECLERIGVKNKGGGYAIIDANATVKVGDLVHCTRVAGTLNSYIKQVKEINGDSIIVGTAYLDESRDFQFEAAEIYGTVIETYSKFPNNYREYVRPTHLRKKDKKGVKNENQT
jgi:hypothetical protein